MGTLRVLRETGQVLLSQRDPMFQKDRGWGYRVVYPMDLNKQEEDTNAAYLHGSFQGCGHPRELKRSPFLYPTLHTFFHPILPNYLAHTREGQSKQIPRANTMHIPVHGCVQLSCSYHHRDYPDITQQAAQEPLCYLDCYPVITFVA